MKPAALRGGSMNTPSVDADPRLARAARRASDDEAADGEAPMMRGPPKNKAALAGTALQNGQESKRQHVDPTAAASVQQVRYRVVVRGLRATPWGEYADGFDAGRVAEQLRKHGLDAVVERVPV
jgi:hypothetical protein